MKRFYAVFLLTTLLATITVQNVLTAGPHHARQLTGFIDSLKKGDVVVFDLDDTLMDLRPRRIEVLKRFLDKKDIQRRFPEIVKAVKQLTVDDIAYSNEATMVGVGILKKEYPDFFSEFHTYFMTEFFTNEAVGWDQPIPGAKEAVKAVYNKEACIVYLSGRPETDTRVGTLASLKRYGFPTEEPGRVLLILKPNPKVGEALLADADFKANAKKTIEKLGTIRGVFDNEPANLVAIRDHWKLKNPKLFFLNTNWSGQKMHDIVWSEDFTWLRDFTH